ncbi:MAG: tRNA dimethylallyltransferase [Patescibacteria group bacterium]|nr:tRNA dimethylallyltransferase [Patescibacteria group bacterium]
MEQLPHLIAVVGPTASGKSDFAVKLALSKNGEIISADSRQIYRGLDIGTGKITREEMRGVPHYMLDIKNPGESFSVVEYVEMVLSIISDVLARGKTPILCGGTGQYIYAVLYNQSFPKVLANENLRKELEQKSTDELFAMLEKKDPTRAQSIDKHNKVRLIRALEILSELSEVPKQENPSPRFSFHIYNLNPSNEIIKERIIKRVEKRLHDGMLEEIQKVLALNLSTTELARCGIEYVELGKYFRDDCSLNEATQSLISKIYHYAKRQKTWNKKYFPEAEIVEIKN